MNCLRAIFVAVLVLTAIPTLAQEIVFDLETNMVSGSGKPGDTLQGFLSLKNYANKRITGDFYFIMIVPSGTFYFFPAWSSTISKVTLNVPPSIDIKGLEIFRLRFGDSTLSSPGPYTLITGFMVGNLIVSNVCSTSFYYS